ncbi:hypothetical protein QWM81_12165 [Streptomyces ficellus]|uniref:Uncharacterized protein n=1 Tax=Streptomyces ficellus TaxID=1977088 RepID=A0ABT7Z6T7_9ACTN|nr:hypothetical protein [Streptomyces ficellus]MDN3294791.1 hypothetical protein [Streptomyces ficellus]
MNNVTSTPYSFVVSVNNPVPASDPRPLHLPPDAETASTIRLTTARRREDTPQARVFTPRTVQRWSRQAPVPFWIDNGRDGSPSCSVRPAAPDAYDVHAPDGTPLARITRRTGRLLPWPRRVQWSAQCISPPRTVTGRSGTWYAWLIYGVTAPVWFLAALGVAVYSFFAGEPDDDTIARPTRTRWRTPGAGTVLDYRGVNKIYRFDPQRLDARVAYALAVLHTWERER